MASRTKSVELLDMRTPDIKSMCAARLIQVENTSSGILDDYEAEVERVLDGFQRSVRQVYGLEQLDSGITAAVVAVHNFGLPRWFIAQRGDGYDFTRVVQLALHPEMHESEDVVMLLRYVAEKAIEHGDIDITINLEYGGTRYPEELDLPCFDSLGFRRDDDFGPQTLVVSASQLASTQIS